MTNIPSIKTLARDAVKKECMKIVNIGKISSILKPKGLFFFDSQKKNSNIIICLKPINMVFNFFPIKECQVTISSIRLVEKIVDISFVISEEKTIFNKYNRFSTSGKKLASMNKIEIPYN